MFLAEAGHLDLRSRIPWLPLGPLLQLSHRLIPAVLLDEQHGQPALTGLVVRISGHAEVVILLGSLKVCGASEQLGLLVVGGPEVVKAVGIARLLGQRLLEMIHRPQIVALLVELHAGRVVIPRNPAAAAGREAGNAGENRKSDAVDNCGHVRPPNPPPSREDPPGRQGGGTVPSVPTPQQPQPSNPSQAVSTRFQAFPTRT